MIVLLIIENNIIIYRLIMLEILGEFDNTSQQKWAMILLILM